MVASGGCRALILLLIVACAVASAGAGDKVDEVVESLPLPLARELFVFF